MRLHSEKQTCPRRRNPTALKTALSGRQTERDGKAFWDAEQSDCHPSSHVRACIASQPRCPRKPRVRPLGTRKGRRRDREEWRAGRFNLDLDALMAHQLDACPAVETTTPIPPENGLRSNVQGMQQHAHLARLRGGLALTTLHCSRRGQGRQLRILAPYTTRRLPSASRRCSWGISFWEAWQRSVPSGWRAKSWPEKRPAFQAKPT